MSDQDKDLPSFGQDVDSPRLRQKLEALREAVQKLMGLRGDRERAAVRWSDLKDGGLVDEQGNIVVQTPSGGTGGSGGGDAPDLTPPPAPTGLTVTPTPGHVIVEFDAPIYSQGGGHKQTNIYATKQPGDATVELVLSEAVRVDTAVGPLTVIAIPSEPFTLWRVWIRFESNDGVESAPVGGTYGVTALVPRLGQSIEDGGLDDSKVANLSAAKLTVGDGSIGGNLKSTNYSEALKLGWLVRPDGFVDFRAGKIGGIQIGGDFLQTEGFTYGSKGFFTNLSGDFMVFGDGGRVLNMAATGTQPLLQMGGALQILANGNATFTGEIQAASGTFGGALSGATGTFAGVLAAGALTPADLDSIPFEYKVPGTFNLTVPARKTGWTSMRMRVTMIGGGGGGGGGYSSWAPNADPAAGGGGGGAGTRVIFEEAAVTPGDIVTIVVGAAGTGGNPSTSWGGSPGGSTPAGNGGTGGSSSYTWNSLTRTAVGGQPGTGGSANYAFSGGGMVTVSGWDVAYSPAQNVPGGSLGGQAGWSLISNSGNSQTGVDGGAGGSSFYGSGAPHSQSVAATAYGAGGGGGRSGNWYPDPQWGGNGGGGYVLVEFFDPNAVVTNQRYQNLISWLDTRGFGTVPTNAR